MLRVCYPIPIHTHNTHTQGEVLSWGLGEIGELGRDVCKLKFPEVEGSDEEPGYDFDGILRDHITPGGMFKELGPNGTTGERMDGVKVSGEGGV